MLNPSPEIQTSSHRNTSTKKECKAYLIHIIPKILKLKLYKSMTSMLFKQKVSAATATEK